MANNKRMNKDGTWPRVLPAKPNALPEVLVTKEKMESLMFVITFIR